MKHDPEKVGWVKELPSVDASSRISEEELKLELKQFRERVTTLAKKIKKESDSELRKNTSDFLKVRSFIHIF